MTPELKIIIELFIGFCIAFFVPCYVIQKLVESFKTNFKGQMEFTPMKDLKTTEPDYTTNPAYSFNLYNTWHKN